MSTWQAILGDQQPSAGGVRQPALALCDHLAVIRVTGDEAGDYLQGQITADLKHIDEGAQRLAMHLSLKGRGLVSARVAAMPGGYLLVVPQARVDDTLRCFEKYKLRAKADFQPDAELAVAQLSGGVDGTLAEAGLPVPGTGQSAHRDGITVLRYAHADVALLVAAPGLLGAHWQALSAERALVDSNGARFQDILAGEAQVFSGGEDLFLPQVLNYDVLGGVSFKKGCYTGQEVVARMHFKGKLKQRMRAFQYQGPPLQARESLRNADGKAVGEVVDSAPGAPAPVALAALRVTHEGELYHGDQPLHAEPLDLPYSLPQPKS